MNATSVDIKDILEQDSFLGLVYADNLFIGLEPNEPINCVVIFDTPGFPPQLTLDKVATIYEYPSVQVRVRNSNYIDGWNLIQSIMTSLHGRAQETWNGTLYSVIYCSSGPALLDWDDNRRPRFIANFNIQRR
jgi:hypothetical protein